MANDPYRNFRFHVDVGGDITEAGFKEVTVPDSTQESIDYREGTDPPWPRKYSGQVKYGNVSLKWGMTDSLALYEWRKAIEDGGSEADRRTVTITLRDEGGDPKWSWILENAWPVKYDSPDLNSMGNEIAIEELEIAHERMTREKL